MNTSSTSSSVAEITPPPEATADQENQGLSKGSLIGSVVTGIAASVCCLGPLVLLTLGISGSWIGNLSVMESYRPIFIGVTLIFLGLAFRKLYLLPQSCAVDKPCVRPGNLRKQRIIFWIVSVFVLVVMSFPWYGPYLLD